MPTDVLTRGAALVVHVWCDGGRCAVTQFLAELHEADRKKMLRRIQMAADHGLPRNEEQCRRLKGPEDLFEFKTRGVRVIFRFIGPGRVLLLHAFRKRTDGTPERETNKAAAAYVRWQESEADTP